MLRLGAILNTNGNGTPYYDPDTNYLQEFISSFGLAVVVAGVEAVEDDSMSLSIYPNPTENLIWIDGQMNSNEEVVIEIFNSLGEVLHYEKLNPSMQMHHRIDLSGYPNGVYLTKVQSGNKVTTKKIVIQ